MILAFQFVHYTTCIRRRRSSNNIIAERPVDFVCDPFQHDIYICTDVRVPVRFNLFIYNFLVIIILIRTFFCCNKEQRRTVFYFFS